MKLNIRKWIKKQRLIRKYTPSMHTMMNDLYLFRLLKDNNDFKKYLAFQRGAELNCVRRLKKL